jgi:2-polyprenyl-3-methyl-5-hydroxy-6-metoxy-1,4-benzoquinol methylase
MLQRTTLQEDRLHTFVGQVLNDLGGAYSIGLVKIGHDLGLYRLLREQGPMTVKALAAASGAAPRYIREWASHHAASGYLAYDPDTGEFMLQPEQAMVFANPDSPVYLIDAFDMAERMLGNVPRVEAAFRNGGGVAWDHQDGCLFCSIARFFRPGYDNHVVANWLPALDGVVEKLTRGANVADVGCGCGYSTVLMAKAFPNSQFVGFDFHEDSILEAREHASRHGAPGNVRFEMSAAKSFPGRYDLVTFFDCLHDMGDPAGAAAHVRQALTPDGTWMIVEPMAQDRLEDNLNPVGRLFYAASTMICVPTSLSQETGAALGAQAGEARLSEIVKRGGGFTRFRRATETPFNMILEARP